MMKYRLSPREIPRAEPEEFPEGSGDIKSYTPTWTRTYMLKTWCNSDDD